MFIIFDIQGFKLSTGKFIVKEVALYQHDEKLIHLFIVKESSSFNKLAMEDKKVLRWLEKYYHGIKWTGGLTLFKELKALLTIYFREKTVYVKGLEKKLWLDELMQDYDVEVIDLDEF